MDRETGGESTLNNKVCSYRAIQTEPPKKQKADRSKRIESDGVLGIFF